MSLRSNIRNKRKSMKFSQEYVAERLQVSRQAVSKWKLGQSEPSTNNLIKWAELFSCDVKEILYSEKSKERAELLSIKQSTMFGIAGTNSFACCSRYYRAWWYVFNGLPYCSEGY